MHYIIVSQTMKRVRATKVAVVLVRYFIRLPLHVLVIEQEATGVPEKEKTGTRVICLFSHFQVGQRIRVQGPSQ